FLVPWAPTTIPAGCAPYPAGGRWAEPDVEAAATTLRRVLEDPVTAKARGEQAAEDIRRLHDPGTAGRAIAARLAEIRAERPRVRRQARLERVVAMVRSLR